MTNPINKSDEVLAEGLEGELYYLVFDHAYKNNGFMNPTISRHDCLNSGYWCWSNFFRHPQDIKGYLKRKLR